MRVEKLLQVCVQLAEFSLLGSAVAVLSRVSCSRLCDRLRRSVEARREQECLRYGSSTSTFKDSQLGHVCVNRENGG